MGYDLTNDRGENFHISLDEWFQIRRLARMYGWEPLGTEPPEHLKDEEKKKWRGGYNSNDWQYVTKEDSKNLIKALKLAYLDLQKKAIETDSPMCFPGMSRYSLKNFLKFLENSGFYIW